ncbi:mucin-like glycoprotein [Trypanosoma conorhini]|uniref:Mucin-like glycoprotein n=1 Tax=Trypanosoma conorhini TaxID=83891 RepID=A0A3R7JZN6_9TRYP|nr:mucin-like glycoprotein [Trypanosoma conorhini]RNE99412.1 mucin-like glycoprotein [Trypanosoma conorhini]
MNFFSRGCGALLRELRGLPPFSSFPSPALTLCAAPHRASHFSLCFFLFAAPQPTGSAATLLPPPPLFLLMTLTVRRRRAVCALALLALLCGCCCASFVCGATNAAASKKEVNVSLEVSCPNSEKKLSWRVVGATSWTQCTAPLESPRIAAVPAADVAAGDSDVVCLIAESFYFGTGCDKPCAGRTTPGDVAALKMLFETTENGALHTKWKAANPSTGAASLPTVEGGQNGIPGVCTLQPPSARTNGEGASAAQPQEVPAAGRTQQPRHTADTAGPAIGPTAAQPRGTGEAQTPPTSAGASDASAAAPAATAAEGATTTTTRSPSAGSHADMSVAIAAAWVRAPLLLLLLASAAGCF